jgi:hypothetical protein
MKFIFLIVVSIFSFQVLAQYEARVNHIFIPKGFDNNDTVEVIINGTFPNICYSGNHVSYEIINDDINIKITSTKRNRKKCEPYTIPFTETVRLGTLQGKSYNITVNKGGRFELKEKININEASSQGVDDHVYALIDYVETGFTGGVNGEVILIGKSPTSCLVFDRVEFQTNNFDTLSVLPILKKISVPCKNELTYLEIPITFDIKSFKNDEILLYVRSINGKSVLSTILKK